MMKENLLLLKDLLGYLRIKFTNLVAVLKNVYIDLLDDIVDKYNNKYHRTIKMKPIDIKKNNILTLKLKVMIKILNLKLLIIKNIQI